MHRHAIALLVLGVGCFEERPDVHDGIGVTSAATMPAAEESSSDGDSSSGEGVELYGRCSEDSDCDWPDGVMLTECMRGTCVYACGDGWGGDFVCPGDPEIADCVIDIHRCTLKTVGCVSTDCCPYEMCGEHYTVTACFWEADGVRGTCAH